MIPFSAKDRSDEDIVLLEDVADEDGGEKFFGGNKIRRRGCAERVREEVGDLRFVRITDDVGDAGECSEFLRGALGVAAGDYNAGGRIGDMELTDSIAGLGVGSGSDGAGVEDDDVSGFDGTGQGAATLEELAFDGVAVGLSGAASELFDEEGAHEGIVYRQRFSVDSSPKGRRTQCR